MVSIVKRLDWIERLANEEKRRAAKARRQHTKYNIPSAYLNAILAHTLTVAKKQGILNVSALPALNLLPDKISGKIK